MRWSSLFQALFLCLSLGERDSWATDLIYRTGESDARNELATRLRGEFRAQGLELRELPIGTSLSSTEPRIEITGPQEITLFLPEAHGSFLVLRLVEETHNSHESRVLAVRAAELVDAWQRRIRITPRAEPRPKEGERVASPPSSSHPHFGASLGPSLLALPDLGAAWGLSASGFFRYGSWLRVELSLHPSLTQVGLQRSTFDGQLSLQMATLGAAYELSIAPGWKAFLGASLGVSLLSLSGFNPASNDQVSRDGLSLVVTPEIGLNYCFSSDSLRKDSSPRLALGLRFRTPLLFEGPILILAEERIPVGRPLLSSTLSLEIEY